VLTIEVKVFHIPFVAAAPAALLGLGVLLLGTVGTATASDEVRAANTNRDAEIRKTIPIAKNRGAKPRSVMSMAPGKVGTLESGDKIEAAGEIQVQVCLKPNFHHGSSRSDCVGPIYGYDPLVDAHLALAPKKKTANPAKVLPVTKTKTLRCHQRGRARNHHCVLTIKWKGIELSDVSQLPCSANGCRLNLILSAHHPSSKGSHKLIVGGLNSAGGVQGGKGKISFLNKRSGRSQPDRLIQTRRSRQRMVVVDEGRSPKMKVVYSQKISDVRAGELLVVDARYVAAIDHLPYTSRMRAAVIITDSPNSIDHTSRRARRAAQTKTRLTEENNFNCTQATSGHSSPCAFDKVGIVRFKQRSKKPLFVNVLAGHGALVKSDKRYRKGRAKVRRSGYLKVWRY
jgi:hypothetical protein